MDEQDRELEAILSQLDIHDDRLGKPPPQQADAYLQQQHQQHQQHQQPSQHDDEMATTCEGCDTEGSMVPLEGVHVCFCCGWSPAWLLGCVACITPVAVTLSRIPSKNKNAYVYKAIYV